MKVSQKTSSAVDGFCVSTKRSAAAAVVSRDALYQCRNALRHAAGALAVSFVLHRILKRLTRRK